MRLMRLSIAAVFAICTACSGSSSGAALAPPIAPLVRSPQSKNLPLIYVVNPRDSNVTVYAYRDATHAPLVQTLSGLSSPLGECVDANQNVFVVNSGAGTIVKFSHGISKPVRELVNPDGYGWFCAVSPSNGDLAVVTSNSGYEELLVYRNAKGTPRVYSDSEVSVLEYPAYDANGNLFVDGWNYRHDGFALVELPKGASALQSLKLRGATITSPGGLQWTDGYLLLADNNYQNQDTTVLYKVKVGSGDPQVVRKLPLKNSSMVGQFWKFGSQVIAPDQNVELYSYRSGDLDGVITDGVFEPSAAVVSLP